MLDKIQALENFVNSILTRLLKVWWKLVHKILPKTWFDYRDDKVEKTKTFINHKKDKIEVLKDNSKVKIKTSVTEIKTKVDELKTFPIKDKAINLYLETSAYTKKTPPKVILTELINTVKSKRSGFSINIKLPSIKKPQLLTGLMSVLFLIIGGTSVYFSTRYIYENENFSREPASVQTYDLKPDYLMYNRRTVQIFNIKIPLTVERVGRIRSVTMDFTVRTTNRFASYYLANYEYKLIDYFFTTTEPVVSDYPLTDEGKTILKEKIQDELNNFLRENGVEGEVEDVRLVFYIAS